MDASERAREEFLSEAEELVAALGRDLLSLDESLRAGPPDPDVVNDIFRAVHTLKGLASLFSAVRLSTLSHELESLLDALRLGRAELNRGTVDLLYESVEVYGELLVAEKESREPTSNRFEALLAKLKPGEPIAPPSNELGDFDFDPSLFAVLTEYEEHRLRTNVQNGLGIFGLRVSYKLATLDESLDRLKVGCKPHGEIITYLPTGGLVEADSIELDILLASRRTALELHAALDPLGAIVTEVPRRARAAHAAPPIMPDGGPPGYDDLADGDTRISVLPPKPGGLVVDPKATTSVRSVTQTVRVDIQKLDILMNIVGELGIVRSALERLSDRVALTTTDRSVTSDLVRLGRTFDRQLEAIQQGILEVRMVPLGQLFERIARVARQIGRDLDKQFHLVITGSETEVDKLIVEELSDPLMHMMRNAIDHGLETPAGRSVVGKPELGTIALNAFQKGSHVVIELEDDGSGIDTEQVVNIALRRGLISPEDVRSTTRKDILQLVFLPGITTRASASEHSGRGVGMDVVKTNIGKLGGVIDLQSEVGIGTKFTITLPITLAIIRALIIEVADRVFAVPLANVREAVILEPNASFEVDGYEAMTLRGTTLRLCRLRQFFSLGDAPSESRGRHEGREFVVVTAAGANRLGLVVDRLVGGQDVVIKALGPSLRQVRGFAGAAELGDQRLGLVLDTPAIIDEISERGNKLGVRRNVG